jgi:hypothetical protein
VFTVFNRGKAVCRTVIPVADMLVDLHNGGAVEVFELMPMAPASRGGDSELKFECFIPDTPGSGMTQPPQGKHHRLLRLRREMTLTDPSAFAAYKSYFTAPLLVHGGIMYVESEFYLMELYAVINRLLLLPEPPAWGVALAYDNSKLGFAVALWLAWCCQAPAWAYPLLWWGSLLLAALVCKVPTNPLVILL